MIYVTPQLFSRLFWHALKNVAAMALMAPEVLLGPQSQTENRKKRKYLEREEEKESENYYRVRVSIFYFAMFFRCAHRIFCRISHVPRKLSTFSTPDASHFSIKGSHTSVKSLKSFLKYVLRYPWNSFTNIKFIKIFLYLFKKNSF